jgi:hypothetical protein
MPTDFHLRPIWDNDRLIRITGRSYLTSDQRSKLAQCSSKFWQIMRRSAQRIMTGPSRSIFKILRKKIWWNNINVISLYKQTNNKMENYTDQELKDELTKRGYFTGNLWHVEDVLTKYKCTPEQSQEILYQSLTNDATMEQIWFSIDTFADLEGYSEINQ